MNALRYAQDPPINTDKNMTKILEQELKIKPRGAGYEYLLAYKITIPIYDYTVEFCNRWINKYSRTHDQMVQAARSGSQNIAEGYRQESLKSYIKLAGVSLGSEEELLKDYQAYARQNNIEIWSVERCKREIGEIGKVWDILRTSKTLSKNPDFSPLPKNKERAVNMMITFINQADSLIGKLITSLEEKHRTEGGFTENLYRRRKEYRGY